MSLIKCPECGSQVSDKASFCVQCGYPLQNKEEEPQKLYYVKIIDDDWVFGKARTLLAQICVVNSNSSSNGSMSIAASGITKDRADIVLDYITKNGGEAEILVDDVSESINQKIMDYIDIHLNKNAPPMCPRCKSKNIVTTQKGFSLLTGFIGSNKTVNRCSKCGYTWEPKR